MVDRRRVNRFLRSKIREAGRQYERARGSSRNGRGADREGPPRDESGRVRIVCRRYAEKRAVMLDEEDRPACFDADHPDCEGCVEDLHADTIETW
ncbi:DUF7091 family protein [Halalkalicoccus ordinarius]|uniref:DUF7091 family protein n=1 Tax=Halalkalicoccus ordinarius TaxID=3116651 RepID=UPI00300F2277